MTSDSSRRTRSTRPAGRRPTWWLAGGLVLVPAACSGGDSGPSEPEVPAIAVTVSPNTVAVTRGESGSITVSLTRTGGFTGAVALSVTGVPDAVTVGSATIGAGSDDAVLAVDVALLAVAGSSPLTVEATASGVTPATVAVELDVQGIPPPWGGTIFIDPDIITSDDPTTFQSLTYAGRGVRTMYDRRAGAFVELEAFLFDAVFDDGLAAEVQVNPEFGDAATAEQEALRYAEVIGRLPTGLRTDVETVWIHRGVEPFGGGNRNLLIHTGQGANYEADGILEETFVHEASHTSLDATHASSSGWIAAQQADGTFISTYARDFPQREDVAETFLTWLAVRHRADRIDATLEATIHRAVPHRIVYFDGQPIDLYPLVER